MANTEAQDKLALVGSKSTVPEIIEDQNKQGSCGKDGITIYLVSGQDKEEDQGVGPLDRAARNELFRQNPQLIAATIAQTRREQANQRAFTNMKTIPLFGMPALCRSISVSVSFPQGVYAITWSRSGTAFFKTRSATSFNDLHAFLIRRRSSMQKLLYRWQSHSSNSPW